MEGPCGSHWDPAVAPVPLFLPLEGFKGTQRGSTSFLHFPNLLSRCGEGGSGASKAPDEPRGAGDPPGGFGGQGGAGDTVLVCRDTNPS